MEQTAVEKLELRLLGIVSFDSEELRARYKETIKKAKEMEEQQQDNFAIEFYDWCNSIEGKYLIEDLKIVGELNKKPTTNELLKIFKNK